MLQLSGAGKRFGHKLLFQDVNWLITPDERTGLVGGNGTGKSTLLKVIAGFEGLDYGQRTHVKGMTLGYLPQDGLALSGRTVFRRVPVGFRRAAEPRKRVRSANAHPFGRRPQVEGVRRGRRPVLGDC